MTNDGTNVNCFPGQVQQMPRTYNDVILTITDATTPDPYVMFDNGTYYMTWTAGNRIEIWSADSLFSFEQRCTKTTVWRPPPNTPYSGDLWAPEIHALSGRWYIYFAADDPAIGNRSHRMFVLEGPPSHQSPLNPAEWRFHGRLEGMPESQWAIDGTVLRPGHKMYFVYSGWPLGEEKSESKQELYIMAMENPTRCKGTPVRISTPDFHWEYSGKSGINEGPQFLQSPDGRWTGIAYSCAGSWTSEYKMAILEYVGGSPVDASSWRKWSEPLLTCSKDGTPPYGPGHGNFVTVNGPGGQEIWGVFHATDKRTGWEGRKARLMRVGWGERGPYMGMGECGFCCNDVNSFLYGTPAAGSGGGHTKPAQGGVAGGKDLKKGFKSLAGQALGLVQKLSK